MKRLLLCLLMTLSISVMGQNIVVHVVQKGETLASIAKKYKTTVQEIRAGNPEANADVYPGMRLEIRTSGAAQPNVGQEPAVQYGVAPTTDQGNQSSQNVKTSQPTNTSSVSAEKKEGVVGGQDYTFMLDPDNKMYGIRMNMSNSSMFGISWGVQWQAMSHGTYGSFLGIGFSPKYAAGPIVLGFHLYPYASLSSFDEVDGYNKKGDLTYKNKTKVSYGAAIDLMAGLKLWTTQKGTGVYLTGSYEVAAPEFKTKNSFKNGMWGIGITLIGIDD